MFVLVVAVHGEARVAGLDHQPHQLHEGRIRRQRDHLRAVDHDVADLQLGHRQGALEHLQRVGPDQAVGMRVAQDLDEVLAGLGLTGEGEAEPFQPGTAFGRVTVRVFHQSS